MKNITSKLKPRQAAWLKIAKALNARSWITAEQILQEQGASILDERSLYFNPNAESFLEHFSNDVDHDVFTWLLAHGAKTVHPAPRDPYFHDDGCITQGLCCRGALQNLKAVVARDGVDILAFKGQNQSSLMSTACHFFEFSIVSYLLKQVPQQLDWTDIYNQLPLEGLRNVPEKEQLISMVRSHRAKEAAQQALTDIQREYSAFSPGAL